jgi:hypothetical protein
MLPQASAFIFIVVAAVVAQFAQLRAQDTPRPAELAGLLIVKTERTIVEGKNGIEITFDSHSAERLRQFTSDAVGRRIVVSVNQRRLATLRLLDPIVEGRILLTGDFDGFATEALFSPAAVLNLEIERSEPNR